MRVCGRLFFIIIIYCSASTCASTERIGRHFVSLFGLRFSERSALRSRPFVYSPVIIIPTLSQKQNFNTQESDVVNSFQKHGDVYQKHTTLSTNATNVELLNDSNRVSFSDTKFEEDTDTEIDPREVENLRSENNITDGTLTTTYMEEPTTILITPEITTTEVSGLIETTEKPTGLYSAPKYNNEFIKHLSLTSSAPLTPTKFALPENNENWKMFSTNINYIIPSYTTKEHFDENRWSRLSSNNYLPSQFRPIAGLYHDGYLHRPLLNKQGFVPSRELYL